jgi:hypothetical protein
MDKKQQIIGALYTFINQRPGLEFGNYGDVPNYRAEVRAIGKDLTQARQLLRYVELRASITADDIIEASRRAYSGRLTITASDDGKVLIDYCTGQYWPTEYRKAVCAVMAAVLWNWKRTQCMPAVQYAVCGQNYETLTKAKLAAFSALPAIAEIKSHYDGKAAGDYLRASFKREFGRGMASRWFN